MLHLKIHLRFSFRGALKVAQKCEEKDYMNTNIWRDFQICISVALRMIVSAIYGSSQPSGRFNNYVNP